MRLGPLLAISCLFALATSRPATQQILPLWPDLPLRAHDGEIEPGEKVTERGDAQKHNRMLSNVTHPSLSVFLPEHADAARAAIIICPGGGYANLAMDKEGYDVAARLNAAGLAAFVLKYRMPDGTPPAPGEQPMPIKDVQRAIRMVRAGAEKWNIDPAKVGVMGFSAGGHVASTAATQFDAADEKSRDPITRQSSRPDFVALLYPVVSMRDDICHKSSRKHLLGDGPSAELIDRYSAELHVDARTPPMFLVHAKDDKAVPMENSVRLFEAARRAGIERELVIFQTGGHGFGLGVNGGEAATWFDAFLKWMQRMKLVDHVGDGP